VYLAKAKVSESRVGFVCWFQCSSGFASLAFAHSAQPHCPRQRTRKILAAGSLYWLGQRRRPATVRRKIFLLLFVIDTLAPSMAQARKLDKNDKSNYYEYTVR
jgi:hypothetical protein